jgi:hypothetical protein
MIIGTFSLAGDRLFTTAERRTYTYNNSRPAQQEPTYRPVQSQPVIRPASTLSRPAQTPQSSPTFRPAPKTNNPQQTSFTRQEPTYHNLYGPNNPDRTNDRSYDA